MINKNEDDKINDKKMMIAMITKMIKKMKKTILTWPSLWLQVFHNSIKWWVLHIYVRLPEGKWKRQEQL